MSLFERDSPALTVSLQGLSERRLTRKFLMRARVQLIKTLYEISRLCVMDCGQTERDDRFNHRRTC